MTSLTNQEIELIFKRIFNNDSSLTSLVLNHEGISGSLITKLAEALRDNSYVLTVNLSGNNLRSREIKILASALKKNISIQKLDLSGNWVRDTGAEFLAEIITDHEIVCSLTALDLSSNMLRSGGISSLAKALTHKNRLLSLNLSGNECDGIAVENLFKALKDSNLRMLDISATRLGENYLQILSTRPSEKEKKSIEKEVILIQYKEKCALGFWHPIRNTYVEVGIGGKSLLKKLQDKTFDGNFYKGNDLTDEINNILVRIDGAPRLPSSGINTLAKWLNFDNNLTELNLSHNVLGNGLINNFVEAVSKNVKLKKLNLSHTQLNTQDALLLAEMIKNNLTLLLLNLSNNHIGNEAVKAFIEAIQVNYVLCSLILHGNKINEENLILIDKFLNKGEQGNISSSERVAPENGIPQYAKPQKIIKRAINQAIEGVDNGEKPFGKLNSILIGGALKASEEFALINFVINCCEAKGISFAIAHHLEKVLIWHISVALQSGYLQPIKLFKKQFIKLNVTKGDFSKNVNLKRDIERAIEDYKEWENLLEKQLQEARKKYCPEFYKTALAECKDILKISETNIDAVVFQGECLIKLLQYKDALKTFSRALNIDPEHVIANQWLNSIRAILGDEKRKLDKVERDYINGQYAEVIDQCTILLAVNSQCLQALFLKADSHYKLNQYDECIKSYDNILKWEAEDKKAKECKEQVYAELNQLNAAELLYREGNFETAVAESKAIIEKNSFNIQALKMVAESYLCLLKLKDALKYFEKILQLQRENQVAQSSAKSIKKHFLNEEIQLFRLNKEQGNYSERINACAAILDKNRQCSSALLLSGDCLVHLKQYEQAIKNYEEILSFDSSHSKAREQLQIAKEAQVKESNLLEEARELYTRVAYEMALDKCKIILENNPNNIEALLTQSKCQIKLLQLKHAKTSCEGALTLSTRHREAKKILEIISRYFAQEHTMLSKINASYNSGDFDRVNLGCDSILENHNKQCTQARLFKANVQEKLSNYSIALDYCREVLSYDNNPQIRERINNLEELSSKKRNAEASFLEAQGFFRREHYRKALDFSNKSIGLFPYFLNVFLLKGSSLEKQYRFLEALNIYTEVQKLILRKYPFYDNNIGESPLIPLLKQKAACLEQMRRIREALDIYKEIQMLIPNDLTISSEINVLKGILEQDEQLPNIESVSDVIVHTSDELAVYAEIDQLDPENQQDFLETQSETSTIASSQVDRSEPLAVAKKLAHLTQKLHPFTRVIIEEGQSLKIFLEEEDKLKDEALLTAIRQLLPNGNYITQGKLITIPWPNLINTPIQRFRNFFLQALCELQSEENNSLIENSELAQNEIELWRSRFTRIRYAVLEKEIEIGRKEAVLEDIQERLEQLESSSNRLNIQNLRRQVTSLEYGLQLIKEERERLEQNHREEIKIVSCTIEELALSQNQIRDQIRELQGHVRVSYESLLAYMNEEMEKQKGIIQNLKEIENNLSNLSQIEDTSLLKQIIDERKEIEAKQSMMRDFLDSRNPQIRNFYLIIQDKLNVYIGSHKYLGGGEVRRGYSNAIDYAATAINTLGTYASIPGLSGVTNSIAKGIQLANDEREQARSRRFTKPFTGICEIEEWTEAIAFYLSKMYQEQLTMLTSSRNSKTGIILGEAAAEAIIKYLKTNPVINDPIEDILGIVRLGHNSFSYPGKTFPLKTNAIHNDWTVAGFFIKPGMRSMTPRRRHFVNADSKPTKYGYTQASPMLISRGSMNEERNFQPPQVIARR